MVAFFDHIMVSWNAAGNDDEGVKYVIFISHVNFNVA
jgi:hypothetical protein